MNAQAMRTVPACSGRPAAAVPPASREADLELEFVEGLWQASLPIHLVHKLAAGCILKDDAAGVLAEREGQEGALQALLCAGSHAQPLPVHPKGLWEGPAPGSTAPILAVLPVFLPALVRPKSNVVLQHLLCAQLKKQRAQDQHAAGLAEALPACSNCAVGCTRSGCWESCFDEWEASAVPAAAACQAQGSSTRDKAQLTWLLWQASWLLPLAACPGPGLQLKHAPHAQ